MTFEDEKTTPPKKFRLQYKTIGLTWSHTSETTFSYSKEDTLKFLQGLNVSIQEYYIVQEIHSNPDHPAYGKPHIHAWIHLSEKPNIRDVRYFDILGCHPNIGNYKKNWIFNYLKDVSKPGGIDLEPLTNIAVSYIELAIAGEYDKAVRRVQQQEPRSYICFKNKIEANLRALGKRKRPPAPCFPLRDYIAIPKDWDPEKKSLVIMGPARIGKTNFAKAWANHHFGGFLKVTTPDELKKFSDERVIIFDDCSYLQQDRGTQIHLCSVEEDAAVNCRYHHAFIPYGTVRIFCCNPDDPPVDFEDDPSIKDRCYIWNVVEIRYWAYFKYIWAVSKIQSWLRHIRFY